MSGSNRRRSLARALTRKIADSPFNPVKFELGVILLVCIGFALVLSGLDTSPRFDAAILAAVASVGAGWLILRVRQVLDRQQRAQQNNGGDDGPKQE